MENFETFRLTQTGPETQTILDQVNTNTADIAQLRALYEALTQNEPVIIQPSDTWPVANPQENVIYRVIDRVNTPPQSYSDYMWNGTAMVLMATYDNAIDNEPTPGSNNLVKSGGVAASIVFDISAYHATGSTLATYANLAAALGTDGANVPASVRKGGMSVKFVQSSDNKYVQYRLMSDTFNTTPANWQGVDDEPTAGSDNLVKSGGVYHSVTTPLKAISDVRFIGTPEYVKDIELNGIDDYSNLYMYYLKGTSAFNFQVRKNSQIVCYASVPVISETDDEYILQEGNQGKYNMVQYQSSGVTGILTLTTTTVRITIDRTQQPIDYPLKKPTIVSDIIEIQANIDAIVPKTRGIFWKTDIVSWNNNHVIVNNAIKEIYLIKKDGAAFDENNIVLGNIRKGYNGNYRVVLYIGNSNPAYTQFLFETTSEQASGTKLLSFASSSCEGYIIIDWDSIADNANLISSTNTLYLLDWEKVSSLAYCPTIFALLNQSSSNNFKDSIVEALNTPDFSWVDDDFPLSSVPRIKNLGLQEGFRSDFAVIPDVSGGTGEYPTDYVFSFSQSKLELMKEMENAGFHCEHHPVHRGWYTSASAGTYQGRQYIEYLISEGERTFRENFIQTSSCLIYPGDSGNNDEAVETVRSHYEYAIKDRGTYNIGSQNPLTLQRLFINLSNSTTKTYYKQKILEAYNSGAWLIIGTHSAQFDDSGAIDETTMSFANLSEIIQYANNLSTIKPISEIYRKRKVMLDLYLVQ